MDDYNRDTIGHQEVNPYTPEAYQQQPEPEMYEPLPHK